MLNKQTKIFDLFVRLSSLVIFLLIWEFGSRIEIVSPLLFPPPSIIARALLEWIMKGEFLRDVKFSYYRMIIGFCLGGFIGIVSGLLTSRIVYIDLCFSPIIQMLRPLPPVAIIPLVIVWLGIGDISKIFSIAFAVFFPVWINTHLGASNIPSVYLWSSKILCKSKITMVFKIFIPAILPSIVAGLRNAISIAFIMVYVSEIAGASSGIGYQISVAHLAYRIDIMMASLLVLALAGATSDYIFSKCVLFIFPWMKKDGNK